VGGDGKRGEMGIGRGMRRKHDGEIRGEKREKEVRGLRGREEEIRGR